MASLHDYGEDRLIEQPAIQLFASLGWQTVNCFHDSLDPQGRASRAEVVLVSRLAPMLRKLNPHLPESAITTAIEEIRRDRSVMLPANANHEVYELLKGGVRVRYQNEYGEDTVDTVRVIDWDDPYNNDFMLASQLWILGDLHKRRTDLIGFVNGIPLLMVELKASHKRVRDAYDDNLRDYRDTIPHLFWYNAFVLLSNGSESLMGSTTATFEHFAEWKRVEDEREQGVISLETMIRATCDPARLLELTESYTLFNEERGGLAKIVAKNHQYLGVKNALQAVERIRENQGRLGVFWHTQGAGKSYSMIFFAQNILRKFPGSWTFVIVTDRTELDDQIYRSFQRAGIVNEDNVQATSAINLRQLLMEDHRYVFTLIHKFRTERGERHPVLSERDDIIVMTDEAHRSQYDTLAQNMREALPNAAFIGFTGTPLMASEQKTREVFGEYISIYNFRQSIEDGATVPLWYENRIPELQLINQNFDADMADLLEEAELDEAQEARLDREFSREYHLITRDERLEKIAADVVEHFIGRGYRGKAMMVSIDKATAIRMYDKVQHHWQARIAGLQREIASADTAQRTLLRDQLVFMQSTDMAVVVSQSQNEIDDFRQKGLEIAPHRRRMINEELDEKFKDADDPLRLVFVCAMWMTGFDVKSCSTIYLDKPMRNHTLMQTIARANRVWRDKPSGLIVDYIGVFRDLERALAFYGSEYGGNIDPGDRPVQDKAALVDALREHIEAALAFLQGLGVDVGALLDPPDWSFVARRDAAVEAILCDDETRKRYLAIAREINKQFKAILPDPSAGEFGRARAVIVILAERLHALAEPPDISGFMADVDSLLDESIAAEGYIIHESENNRIDLSGIDFDKLRKNFRLGQKRTQTEKLRGSLVAKISEMVRFNKTRASYQDRLQRLIDEYNAGSRNIESLFDELMNLTQDLSQEDQRTIAENLSEEDLALFDILTRPGPALTQSERDQVKGVVKHLLATLKNEKLVLDWRNRRITQAAVETSINTILDQMLPPAYDPDLYRQKCRDVYEHIHEAYAGNGRSIYTAA